MHQKPYYELAGAVGLNVYLGHLLYVTCFPPPHYSIGAPAYPYYSTGERGMCQ